MNNNRRFGAFSSSENPDELAGRVKATILMFSSLIIWGAALIFKITLTPEDVIGLATQMSGITALLWGVYSGLKAFSVWAIDKWNSRTV